ncbi:MAG: fibronectin type III domain-containing protein [Vicingus serpentipes]|nr:fibronectin type III domain-containing protein [Vicingus serpentipes]
MKKWKVVLRLSSQSVPQKIDQARFVVKSMSNNVYFPKPYPKLATITEKAAALQEAYTASRDAGKELTSAMHAKEFELEIAMIALGNYVQNIANNDNEIGDVIIYSAGMEVRKPNGSLNKTFAVQNTTNEGRVKLHTKSEGRVAYIWEYSSDQEEWIQAGVTTQAATIINGLTPGKRYYFRVATAKAEQGP